MRADVAFAPDGSQFAALQLNGIGLWDGHTGEYQGSLPIPDLAPARRFATSSTAQVSSSPPVKTCGLTVGGQLQPPAGDQLKLRGHGHLVTQRADAE